MQVQLETHTGSNFFTISHLDMNSDIKISTTSIFTDADLYLLGEGTHHNIYQKLGAQLINSNGQDGVNFAVWAPNAREIQVIGDFNRWNGLDHSMQRIKNTGIWELFIPDLEEGELYKFRITQFQGRTVDKTDPYGFWAEVPPNNASIVANLNGYEWSDEKWMKHRSQSPAWKGPMSIYEMHLGSWQQGDAHEHGWINYRKLAHEVVEYCKKMGYTHVELLPVSEHPYTGSWGYQTVGYYSVTSRYGSPEDFMFFVDLCHQNDIGVIIDWVPAHFPKDLHGLSRFDGTALYEHSDPRQGEHPDWGTYIFNYGRNEVKNYLVANAHFWLDKYHIDGLRFDAVASMLYLDYSREEGQWIPNRYGGRENLEAVSFLKYCNQSITDRFPGAMTIAEESTAWPGVSRPTNEGGLGFTLKWNMGWMNDTLRYFHREPIYRKFHHDELTFSLIYAYSEHFILPFSHDEIVHGKGSLLDQMPGDVWRKFANLRLLLSYQWTHPGKKLIFMGSDFGQWTEWNCNDALPWQLLEKENHQGIQKLVSDLNRLYREQPALHELDFCSKGFEWIDCHNRDESNLSYIRHGNHPDDDVFIVANFTPTVRNEFAIGVSKPGKYDEIFNSDSKYYGGSNVGNPFGVDSSESGMHGRDHSISITIPPLAIVAFKRQNNKKKKSAT
jgi:1,4-alpha-glucan branching enzyme